MPSGGLLRRRRGSELPGRPHLHRGRLRPRGHPLLTLDNVTIAPHLGSATEQTRRKMAEISVENLLRGLRGEEMLHRVA